MIDRQAMAAAAAAFARDARARVTSAMMTGLSAVLARGEPPWWGALAAAVERRFWAPPGEWLLKVRSAAHFEALGGHPMRAHFFTCGGEPGPGAAETFAAFFAAPTPGFAQALRDRPFSRYSQFWHSQWIPVAKHYFQDRRMSYAVVELNSVGGLGVVDDQISGWYGFEPSLIEARVAVEEKPLDLTTEDDARWLCACEPPEGPAILDASRRAGNLRIALAKVPTLLQRAVCSPPLMPAFVARNIPVDPEAGLVVSAMHLAAAIPPTQLAAATQAASSVLEAWQGRAIWIEVERVAGGADKAELRAHLWRDGKVQSRTLYSAELTATGALQRWDRKANAAFLKP